MTNIGEISAAAKSQPALNLMDGSKSQQSYGVIARRGNLFLGIRFSGLMDGAQLGVPGKTYLHARLRSARNQQLAKHLDLTGSGDNVVDLFDPQLALDAAWPNLSFEKIDGERASLGIGAFVQGSLSRNTVEVLRRIGKGDLFIKMIDFAIQHGGAEHCIVDPAVASAWLFKQAKPVLRTLKKANAHKQIKEVEQEFQASIDPHMKVVGAHQLQLQNLHQKYTASILNQT